MLLEEVATLYMYLRASKVFPLGPVWQDYMRFTFSLLSSDLQSKDPDARTQTPPFLEILTPTSSSTGTDY